MKVKPVFPAIIAVLALFMLSGITYAEPPPGVQPCTDQQARENPHQCPGYWATFSSPGQAEPDPPPGNDNFDGDTVEIDPESKGATSDLGRIFSAACNFETQGDNPHHSSRPAGDVSVHGWWNDNSYYGDGSCPENADITVKLKAYYCIWSDPSRFCWYRTLRTEDDSIRARNLSHKRLNARHSCTRSTSNYRYRNVVDVDVAGQSRSMKRTADVTCAPNRD